MGKHKSRCSHSTTERSILETVKTVCVYKVTIGVNTYVVFFMNDRQMLLNQAVRTINSFGPPSGVRNPRFGLEGCACLLEDLDDQFALVFFCVR